MKYNQTIRKLYFDIDRFTKSDDTVKSLQDLQKRLRQEQPINLQEKIEGEIIGEALLNFAVEDTTPNVVKFLFDNGLKIIDVVSKKDRTYRIIKTKSGESILSYAISHSSIEVIELILNSIDEQQSALSPQSDAYKLYQKIKKRALNIASDGEKDEVVKLILNSIDAQQSVVSTPNGNLTGENSNISNGISPPKANASTPNGNLTAGKSNVSNGTNPPQAKDTPNGNLTGENSNVSNGINPPQANAKTPNDDVKKDFYVALVEDVLGTVVLAAFVTSAIILPSIHFAIAAVLTAMIIGVHVNNYTVPSYMEMHENSVDEGKRLGKK